jgi:hypothetical protein
VAGLGYAGDLQNQARVYRDRVEHWFAKETVRYRNDLGREARVYFVDAEKARARRLLMLSARRQREQVAGSASRRSGWE